MSNQNPLLKAAVLLIEIIYWPLLSYIIFFLLVFLLPLIPGAAQYPVLRDIIKIEQTIEAPAVSFFQSHFPTKYRGVDYAYWIFFGTIVLAWSAVGSARFLMKAWALPPARRDEASHAALEQAELAVGVGPVQSALAGASREQLLELYTHTKRSLESQKRPLSFLAIDVVNSTGMKVGEDPAVAERDFRQYKQLVESVIKEHGGLKAAWTPDGVMICFPNTESAVKAAQSLINKLEQFNKTVKAMRSDFKIRAGINAGMVMFDEAVPMEEMSSREIDIAGHMQKYAGENSVYIDKDAIQSAGQEFGFKPANREIDGRPVYEWKPGKDPA